MYFEIQSLNEYGRESLQALRRCSRAIVAQRSRAAMRPSSSTLMQQGREYFAGRVRRSRCDGERGISKARSANCGRGSRRSSMRRRRTRRLLKRSQERELELLKAENLPQLFEAICKDSKLVWAGAVTLLLLGSATRDPSSADRRPTAGRRFPQVLFADSVVELAPQFGSFHRPWLGPYMGCDHQLLFPRRRRAEERRADSVAPPGPTCKAA